MRVTLGDIEVAYTVSGDGDPVVLVHGLAEERASWAAVQARLGRSRSYAYDLRGHGETEAGAGEGTLRQLAGDLTRFLETVSGPARCVGYSLGGTIVLAAAIERPELVTGLVVSGTSTVVGRAAVGFFEARIHTLEADRDAFAAALRDDTAAQITRRGVDVDAVAARRLSAVGDGRGYVNAARAMVGLRAAPLTPRLADVRCHVDVVGGDADAFCPRKAADIMLEALEHGAYHELAECGHLMTVDQPVAYAGLIAELIER